MSARSARLKPSALVVLRASGVWVVARRLARRGGLPSSVAALLLSALMLAVGVTGASATGAETVAVSASAGSVEMGANLTYTVSIGPSGGTPATMTDQINGMTNLAIASSSGSCTQSAGLVTCQTTLAVATTVTITGTVSAPAGARISLPATAFSLTGLPPASRAVEAVSFVSLGRTD